ncbi:hypothetical protein BLA18110_07835 [Burkholderia lata]|nr:hypothetical protein BLA18110_07835 [Burkholderia lata]
MQTDRCIDAFIQKRTGLAEKLDRLIEESMAKDIEIMQVRREAAMNQFRDRIVAERTEVIRSEVSVHRERRDDEEAEEIASIRRVAAVQTDE